MTYAFFNFNTYLGGGETLMVRMAEFLGREHYDYKMFYKTGSYIEKDLYRIGVEEESLCPIHSKIDYYYLESGERHLLRTEIENYLKDKEEVCLVSFDARELYTVFDIAKNNPKYRVGHLILHNQDNLYVCQSLLDKLKMRFGGKRRFSRKAQIRFNKQLFNTICNQSIVIPQSELQADLLKEEYDINTEKEKVVPLPSYDFTNGISKKPKNNNKIIWIGRIVDFKLPALIAMLEFISTHPQYTLTVVGDGEIDKVKSYATSNAIDLNNVTFAGKVDYSKLGEIIQEHGIGYAMGTSIIEIGKYGIPVIMALGSPDFKLFDRVICGGLYYHQSRGNVGDTLFYKKAKDPVVGIEDAVREVDQDYESAAFRCYESLKANFDEKTDFSLYMHWLKKSRSVHSDLHIPTASWLRKKLFFHF